MKNVIFLSPPLAGKGTMSEFLVKNYNYHHISTGNMLRSKALEDESIKNILASGKLVSDELILSLLEENLDSNKDMKPFILDGLPRTLQQAQKLDIILANLGIRDYVVVYIDVPKEVLLERLLGRRICLKCQRTYNLNLEKFKPRVSELCDDCGISLSKRSDDNIDSFTVRYEEYMAQTHPLIDYYKGLGKLVVIHNENDSSDVFSKLMGVLND